MKKKNISKSITLRDSESFNRYLRDVSKYPLLTLEEEIDLARKVKLGDEDALHKLVNSNLRFVISMAKQFSGFGVELEDLVAEGNIGLVRAAHDFDETLGFKFTTYAVNWIMQALYKTVSEQSRVIRLPQNKVTDILKVRKTATRLEQKLQRIPMVNEIAEDMGYPEFQVEILLRLDNRAVSLNSTISSDSDTTLEETLSVPTFDNPDKTLMQESQRQEIDSVLDELPDKEAQVLRLLYGFEVREYTLDEVGDMLQLSRERVRQIRDRALRRLKKSDRLESLRSLLAA